MKWLRKVPYELFTSTLLTAFSQKKCETLYLEEGDKSKVQRRMIFLKQWKSSLKH